jgi:hypothetical protein
MTNNQVRQAAHFADTAKAGLQFGLLALHVQTLFLGQAVSAALPSARQSDFRRWIDCDTVFQLVSVPPSQRWFM